jgi:hypothetical protein
MMPFVRVLRIRETPQSCRHASQLRHAGTSKRHGLRIRGRHDRDGDDKHAMIDR